jgi:hypothetical protein
VLRESFVDVVSCRGLGRFGFREQLSSQSDNASGPLGINPPRVAIVGAFAGHKGRLWH